MLAEMLNEETTFEIVPACGLLDNLRNGRFTLSEYQQRMDTMEAARSYLAGNGWKLEIEPVDEGMLAFMMGCGCGRCAAPKRPTSWTLPQEDFDKLNEFAKMATRMGIKEDVLVEHLSSCLELREHPLVFRLELLKLERLLLAQ